MTEVKKGSEIIKEFMEYFVDATYSENAIFGIAKINQELKDKVVVPEEKWYEMVKMTKQVLKASLELDAKLRRIEKILLRIVEEPIYSKSWNIREIIAYEVSPEQMNELKELVKDD